mgnify:FL=1
MVNTTTLSAATTQRLKHQKQLNPETRTVLKLAAVLDQ